MIKLDNMQAYIASEWTDCDEKPRGLGKTSLLMHYLILHLGTLVGVLVYMTLDLKFT